MIVDATQLDAELRAAGLPVDGCRSEKRDDQDGLDPVTQLVDWPAGHPTPAERSRTREILEAHDPDRRRNEQAARKASIALLEAKVRDETASLADLRILLKLEIEQRRIGGGL